MGGCVNVDRLVGELPEVLIPAIPTCELGLSNEYHMLDVFAGRMLAPSRASDPAILEMAARPTLSLHHQTTPASPESEKARLYAAS
jgi:hypothetical protein